MPHRTNAVENEGINKFILELLYPRTQINQNAHNHTFKFQIRIKLVVLVSLR